MKHWAACGTLIYWIPAFAGMTTGVAGMTTGKAGMTTGKAGMMAGVAGMMANGAFQSFYVLDMLAHLFDQYFEFNRCVACIDMG